MDILIMVHIVLTMVDIILTKVLCHDTTSIGEPGKPRNLVPNEKEISHTHTFVR